MADIESEAALLEGVDIARSRFRFTSLADQVEAASKGALAQGVIGGVGSIFDWGHTSATEERIKELESEVERLSRLGKSKTVIQPIPTPIHTLYPRAVKR